MKRYLIILAAIVILIGLMVLIKTKSVLPQSFTMNLQADLTSSGASRNYDASLRFNDAILVDGVSHYIADTTTGRHIEYECVVKDLKWVDKITSNKCQISFEVSLTKEGLDKQIKNGDIKPMGNCNHLDICYNLIK